MQLIAVLSLVIAAILAYLMTSAGVPFEVAKSTFLGTVVSARLTFFGADVYTLSLLDIATIQLWWYYRFLLHFIIAFVGTMLILSLTIGRLEKGSR